MEILLEFRDFNFVIVNFLESLIVDFLELIEIEYEIGILFHFPLVVKFFGLEDFLIAGSSLDEGLLDMNKMPVDFLGSGIFGLFLHVLKMIFLDVGLVELDKCRRPLFLVKLVDNGKNLPRHLIVKSLLVLELDTQLDILLFQDLVQLINFLYSLIQLVGFLHLLIVLLIELKHLLLQSVDQGFLRLEFLTNLCRPER